MRSSYTKSPLFETSRILPDQDSLISMIDEEQHKDLKAKLTPGVRF